MDKETILGLTGEFVWFWGKDWFIETSLGNFHWYDPDYGDGDNTIAPFPGTITDFCRKMSTMCGRGKGVKTIETMCGQDIVLVTDQEQLINRFYKMSPAVFRDRVDGFCIMPWDQAVAENHPKVAEVLGMVKRVYETFPGLRSG